MNLEMSLCANGVFPFVTIGCDKFLGNGSRIEQRIINPIIKLQLFDFGGLTIFLSEAARLLAATLTLDAACGRVRSERRPQPNHVRLDAMSAD